MNKNVIIGLVVLLLLGGGAYFAFGGSDDDSSQASTTNDSSSSSQVADVQENESSEFPISELVYPVTMSGEITDSSDADNNGTMVMAFKDETTWKMMLTAADGTTSSIVYLDDFSYIEEPTTGTWLKIPIGQEDTTSASDFGLDQQAFSDYREYASYEGKQACTLGMCDTWKWNDPEGTGDTATIKFGSSGQIAEVTTVTGTTTSIFSYDYNTPVTVEAPENVTSLDGLVPPQ